MTPAKLEEIAREAGLTIDGDNVTSGYLDCVAREDLVRLVGLVLEAGADACEEIEPVTYRFGGELHDDAASTRRACVAALRALAKQEGSAP